MSVRELGVGFREPISRWAYVCLATGAIVLLLGVWDLTQSVQEATGSYVPRLSEIAAAAAFMFEENGFAWDIGASGLRIFGAFGASALIAVPLGLLMSSYKVFDALFGPIIDFVRYVPVPALLPLFVLWAGIGEAPKFLVLFFGTFFQLVLLVKDDADHVPDEHLEIARTLGASNGALIKDVLFPFLKPTIYDRLRVTLGWCWTYLVIAELVAVERGVGHAIKEAQRFDASDQLFVCLVTLGLIGLLTDLVAKQFYSRAFPYAAKPGN